MEDEKLKLENQIRELLSTESKLRKDIKADRLAEALQEYSKIGSPQEFLGTIESLRFILCTTDYKRFSKRLFNGGIR